MTQDEIIAMAEESGFGPHLDLLDVPHFQADAQRLFQKLDRFSALVAAKEREACLEIADMEAGLSAHRIAQRIRARGTKEGA